MPAGPTSNTTFSVGLHHVRPGLLPFHEPSIADALATIPPLPCPADAGGEGRGEGSVLSLRFMVTMRGDRLWGLPAKLFRPYARQWALPLRR